MMARARPRRISRAAQIIFELILRVGHPERSAFGAPSSAA
jgi:hypothetical protein